MNEITIQDIAKFLINPLLPAFLLLFMQALKRRPGRGLSFLILLYLYFASTPLCFNFFIRAWKVEDTLDAAKTYDAAVPLVGVADHVWYEEHRDIRASFPNIYLFGSNVERVIRAAELLSAGRARKLLFGEQVYGSFNEGPVVKDFLLKQGFSAEQVCLYGEVENTAGEASMLRQYADRHGVRSIILVTSQEHMRRAAAMFRKQGFDPALVSVKKAGGGISPADFIPSKKGLSATEAMLYELMGYAGYAVKGKL